MHKLLHNPTLKIVCELPEQDSLKQSTKMQKLFCFSLLESLIGEYFRIFQFYVFTQSWTAIQYNHPYPESIKCNESFFFFLKRSKVICSLFNWQAVQNL